MKHTETEMDDDDVRSGTGPCRLYRKGMTVSGVDIISSTETNDLFVRAARPELTTLVPSSSSTAWLLGCAAFRNNWRALRLG